MNIIRRKVRTFLLLLKEGDWQGIAERLVRRLGPLIPGKALDHHPVIDVSLPGVDIICTPHTRFVAQRVSVSLVALGITPVRILDTPPARYARRLHIVICPQMPMKLPHCYIAFQMEQSVSSRWFNESYRKRLEGAVAIMEYSLYNVAYLQETFKLSHQQIFYTPISNLPAGCLDKGHQGDVSSLADNNTAKMYDVAFYGDANTPRRQAFLNALEKHYCVLRISEIFGDELYIQLAKARLIVNVHYYEDALLETTRLYECLSLGHAVVSEKSVDMEEHATLLPYVTFTPIGDIEAMVAAIGKRLETLSPNSFPTLPNDIAHFHFYFTRLMVALDQADACQLDNIAPPIDPEALSRGVGLSLPETYQRRAVFQAEFPDYPIFPGLRHAQGWRGCALSYRYMARQARACGLNAMEVREDDVCMDAAARQRWARACRLFDERPELDVLSGLMADIADDVAILENFEYEGEHYIVINRMTSTVCNRYGTRAMGALADWPFEDNNAERNTIDRYLERLGLSVLVPLPFIVQHRADSHSTLWHFQNTTYDALIEASEKRLMNLARQSSINHKGV
ncbi:hypothetical protein GCM10022228_04740 [Halomonas cibimaris]|uniref:Uncharacterized protein n=1 Tax=Halomonas cibimaris TaxID=657012 RepID=A0ABP7LCW3_9GAMM